jgi:hypothetical protein
MFLAMMLAMMFACEHGLAIVLAVSQQQWAGFCLYLARWRSRWSRWIKKRCRPPDGSRKQWRKLDGSVSNSPSLTRYDDLNYVEINWGRHHYNWTREETVFRFYDHRLIGIAPDKAAASTTCS